jgi:hypothetical protein
MFWNHSRSTLCRLLSSRSKATNRSPPAAAIKVSAAASPSGHKDRFTTYIGVVHNGNLPSQATAASVTASATARHRRRRHCRRRRRCRCRCRPRILLLPGSHPLSLFTRLSLAKWPGITPRVLQAAIFTAPRGPVPMSRNRPPPPAGVRCAPGTYLPQALAARTAIACKNILVSPQQYFRPLARLCLAWLWTADKQISPR